MDAPLTLPARMTIGDLAPLRERLAGGLNARRELALDGGPVTAIDTAGLQLLAVLCQDAAERGVVVRWTGASPELTASAALLGLSTALGLSATYVPEDAGGAPQP